MTSVSDAEALLAEQDALQAQVNQVRADLDLESRLSALGRPMVVGAAALGLMVARDLDITTVCAALDADTAAAVASLGAALVLHPRVRSVVLRDDTGNWNVDPAYPDGLFVGLQYRSPDGADWRLDLWFVDEPQRQPDLADVERLRPQLTDDKRTTILRLKRVLLAQPRDNRPSSAAVYQAVIDDGVRTLEELDAWASNRQHPARSVS